jgi:hypothetical protein
MVSTPAPFGAEYDAEADRLAAWIAEAQAWPGISDGPQVLVTWHTAMIGSMRLMEAELRLHGSRRYVLASWAREQPQGRELLKSLFRDDGSVGAARAKEARQALGQGCTFRGRADSTSPAPRPVPLACSR